MRNSNRNFFLFWYHFFVFMEVFGGIPIYILWGYQRTDAATTVDILERKSSSVRFDDECT